MKEMSDKIDLLSNKLEDLQAQIQQTVKVDTSFVEDVKADILAKQDEFIKQISNSTSNATDIIK